MTEDANPEIVQTGRDRFPIGKCNRCGLDNKKLQYKDGDARMCAACYRKGRMKSCTNCIKVHPFCRKVDDKDYCPSCAKLLFPDLVSEEQQDPPAYGDCDNPAHAKKRRQGGSIECITCKLMKMIR